MEKARQLETLRAVWNRLLAYPRSRRQILEHVLTLSIIWVLINVPPRFSGMYLRVSTMGLLVYSVWALVLLLWLSRLPQKDADRGKHAATFLYVLGNGVMLLLLSIGLLLVGIQLVPLASAGIGILLLVYGLTVLLAFVFGYRRFVLPAAKGFPVRKRRPGAIPLLILAVGAVVIVLVALVAKAAADLGKPLLRDVPVGALLVIVAYVVGALAAGVLRQVYLLATSGVAAVCPAHRRT